MLPESLAPAVLQAPQEQVRPAQPAPREPRVRPAPRVRPGLRAPELQGLPEKQGRQALLAQPELPELLGQEAPEQLAPQELPEPQAHRVRLAQRGRALPARPEALANPVLAGHLD